MMGVNMVAISSLHQIPLLLPDLRLYASQTIEKFNICSDDAIYHSNNKKPSYCWDSQPFVAIFRT